MGEHKRHGGLPHLHAITCTDCGPNADGSGKDRERQIRGSAK